MKVTKKEQWAPIVIDMEWPDELDNLVAILTYATKSVTLTARQVGFAEELKSYLEEANV